MTDEQIAAKHDQLRDQRDEAAYQITFAKTQDEYEARRDEFVSANRAWEESVLASVRHHAAWCYNVTLR